MQIIVLILKTVLDAD